MVQDITTVDTVARSLKGLDPSYASADVVMIVYSIDDPESFEDAWYKWFKEVSDFCPNAPVILVACKSDLREEVQSSSGSLISNHDGTMMSQRMFAHSFIETSAKAQHNVDLAFASAARAVLTVANQEAKRVSQKTVRKRIDELKNDMEDLWEKVQDLIHPPSKEPIQPTSLIS
ncbi:hypothetical protein FRC03_003927 [Tulasnella sp. 419]|nr:hypothetical protein FRC03_003927 [Tulasnella sp. 419]